MGSKAVGLEEGSTGDSQIQLLPLQPLHAKLPALKLLQHLPSVAWGFPRTAAMPGQRVRL